MHSMRLQLCRQILAAPLLHLEQLGSARLLTTLTDDIPVITNAVLLIPLLCVNAALVIGCLIYLGILSWGVFLIVLTFMILGIATYQAPIIKVQKIFRSAREHADKLQEHFRALTLGAKELGFITSGGIHLSEKAWRRPRMHYRNITLRVRTCIQQPPAGDKYWCLSLSVSFSLSFQRCITWIAPC